MGNPWYPWYTGDYRRDTSNLTQGQHGAYRLLLDHYYSTGKPLPCLEQCLRIACSFTKEERAATKFVLESFFTLQTDGAWYNKKAAKIVKDQEEKRAKAKEKAEAAARARWGKDT
jgi:uncharacterized protein YdaU (DUF1376 family)